MIFTTVSKVGDSILLCPLASEHYKRTGEKITWLLTKSYKFHETLLKPFLEMQLFTDSVHLVDSGHNAFLDSHWRYNPEKFGFSGEYKNFGLPKWPDKYLSAYYSENFDMPWDSEFIPNYINEFVESKNSVILPLDDPQRNWYFDSEKGDSFVLSHENSVNTNLNYCMKAGTVKVGMSFLSIVLDMLNKPSIFYGVGDHINQLSWFYKTPLMHDVFIRR